MRSAPPNRTEKRSKTAPDASFANFVDSATASTPLRLRQRASRRSFRRCCISTVCRGNESTACCFRPSAGADLVRRGRRKDLIDAAVAMKRRNRRWGWPRIAQQIVLAFGVEFGRSFLAYVSWPDKGQCMELRIIPLRIGRAENTLGSRCNEPIYAPHQRV